MPNKKKFFWLKLKDDFFATREVKKLRRVAGGDTYTVIYLKMQLLSIKEEGVLIFEGTEESLAEQLSIELDEDEHNVKMTLAFLEQNKLIEQLGEDEFLLNKVPETIGSETNAAERMRRMRERRNNVTPQLPEVTKSYTEIEKEKELEIEKDKSIVPNGTSTLPKTNKYKIFFETYNEQSIVNHQKITQKMKQAIDRALKKNSQEEILEAIKRYGQAYNSAYKFAKFKMTLDKFLAQGNGYSDWLDEGQKWINYSDFKEKGATYAEGTKQNEPKSGKSDIAEQAGVLSF